MNKLLLKKQFARWYPLIPVPVQIEMIQSLKKGIRFPVVPAGRRSGKTERWKRVIAKQAMGAGPVGHYFCAAPTYQQAKRPNGSTLSIIGMDKPERFEGVPWLGGVIDEIANLKEGSWQSNIKPALDTVFPHLPGYKPFCALIGVPEGLNNFYELAEYARLSGDPEWALFHWKSSVVLPPETIAAAKRSLSKLEYEQEYEASFKTAQGRIYPDYDDNNLTDATIKPHEQLLWSHDQNYTPLSSSVAVQRDDTILFLDEIILTSAVSRQSAEEFCDKFKNHRNKLVIIYGDPAGNAGKKHGHKSDYSEIVKVLENHGWLCKLKVKSSAPPIKDRQNSVRAMIKSADGKIRLLVNKTTAPWCHKALNTVQLKKGSTFLENDTNKYQHISTAIGYFIHVAFPIGKRGLQSKVI